MSFLRDVMREARGAPIVRGPSTRAPRSLRAALERPGRRIVAEIKRRSPSAGHLRDLDAEERARAYERAGAAAISVLTSGRFDGAPLDLALVAGAVSVPVLRKDFLARAEQIEASRSLGADAVLLIVRGLERRELEELLRCARALGMDALVEAHDERELDEALALGADIVGLNHRDLDTLVIDPTVSERLLPRVPEGVIAVVCSGVRSRRDMSVGRCFLVGEALSRAEDPARALEELL